MGEVSGREAGAAAYMLANGQGKARAGRAGQARPSARWRTMILSSGEISLADKMAEGGERVKAGQEVRLLDIPADGRSFGAFDALHGAPSPAAFAEQVDRAAAAAYGTAGPAFVEALLSDFDQCLEAIRKAVEAFAREATRRFGLGEADGQVARALKRLGLVAAAGEAASALGLTGWPAGTAREALFVVLGLWLESRGSAGAAEAREAVERTRAFIVRNGSSRFERLSELGEVEAKTINRAGWRDEDYYYVAPDVWRGEVHAGADPARAARHLMEAGLLEPGDGRNLMKRTPCGVPSRPRAYAVKADIIGAGDD